MGCKCQETKLKMDTPCTDSNDESYRQAYLDMNKKYVRLNAEKQELETRLAITQQKAAEYIETMSQKLAQAEGYASALVTHFDMKEDDSFFDKHGYPPKTLKIG